MTKRLLRRISKLNAQTTNALLSFMLFCLLFWPPTKIWYKQSRAGPMVKYRIACFHTRAKFFFPRPRATHFETSCARHLNGTRSDSSNDRAQALGALEEHSAVHTQTHRRSTAARSAAVHSMSKQQAAACLAALLSLPHGALGRTMVIDNGIAGGPAVRALRPTAVGAAGAAGAGAGAGAGVGAGGFHKHMAFVPPTLAVGARSQRPPPKLSRTVEPTDQFFERTASLEKLLRTLSDHTRCLHCPQK
jgi:hypothetical protein